MCRKLVYLASVVAILFVAAPAGALLTDWEETVAPASSGHTEGSKPTSSSSRAILTSRKPVCA
jgi:hypothetical protein